MAQDEIVTEFVVESYENLDRLEKDLVVLEKDPRNQAVLAAVFRNVHTIKGTSSFLSFQRVEKVSHAAESVLSLLRDGAIVFTSGIGDALLALVDALRTMLGHIERTGHEGEVAVEPLIERFLAIRQQHLSGRSAATPTTPPAPAPVIATTTPAPVAKAVAPEVVEPPTPVHEASADAAKGESRSLSDSTVRVDVTLLDRLMNLVGELVLARNQVLQHSAAARDASFLATSQRINALTTELQEAVMKTRLQPIDHVLSKFPRVVRDLGAMTGKSVELEMEGRDTELDRTIIEAIRDPLTHLVRNAVDHGLETPEQRAAAGKNPQGRLLLRAYHEGGQVNIELTDDGAGISPEKVRRKALEKGLISPERAASLSERDVTSLIFLPGFSTADKVTNVSGRGVGLDVVKTHIEKIGGSVEVHSRQGHGTTFKLKIPLTLAIVPALIVHGGGQRFAIPQVSLLELVHAGRGGDGPGVEHVRGAPVYRLRDHLLPLVDLAGALELKSAHKDGDGFFIVVLQAGGAPFGLVVDDVGDTEEIVVKPLGQLLNGLSAFSGATIMGDGKVALILDVPGLAQRAGIAHAEQQLEATATPVTPEDVVEEERQSVLLFKVGEAERMAIPLSEVSRLEEIDRGSIEELHGRAFVKYLGGVMPLVRVTEVVSPGTPLVETGARLQVVVHAFDSLHVGLVVDGLLDVVSEPLRLHREVARKGIAGCAVLQNRVTEVVDVFDLVTASGAHHPAPPTAH